ncbi:MAG: DNA alkylation repair protein [Thiothrix sp.]|uniref:DNA alkylation repair protein n=1 Tax=Thiothrix sp. TaxID=1032 RepID=UPI0026187930|nr:DNA alkylation repair protein [Thiothrix sp.]MDD5393506.1 DNA alkylation repair protein [Thiothrix sp.]
MNPTLQHHLTRLANPVDAANLQRFFKTAHGEYGAGDQFRGIRVPALRQLVKQYPNLSLPEVETLLHSPWHEDRLLALLMLVRQYPKADAPKQADIFALYLRNLPRINNWDLVDTSAEHIIGAHLLAQDRALLTQLVASTNLWERRIAVMATFHFIKRGDFADTLTLAARLLTDREDLIHKAVGWMLREIGKRDLSAEETFLQTHYRQMPRTMLRYAIEKLPEERRQQYLSGTV